MPDTMTCECSDPGCPAHEGVSECTNEASSTVRRIDMEDGTTTFEFCQECTEDALESGVFDTQDEDADGEEEEEPSAQASEELLFTDHDFNLKIKLGNAAFSDGNLCGEVSRIIREAAARIRAHEETDFTLRDVNGNTVGFCQIDKV